MKTRVLNVHARMVSRISAGVALSLLALAGCDRAVTVEREAPIAEAEPQAWRYSVVGRFDGTFAVFADGGGSTDVEDRFELVFVTDAAGEKMIDEPQIANFGSRLVEPSEGAAPCKARERTSYFDRAEVVSVALANPSTLELATDTHLAGAKAAEGCAGDGEALEPRVERAVMTVVLPLGALRAADGVPVAVSVDGWSFSFTRTPIDSGAQ